MILYLDSSAAVKRYVAEEGTAQLQSAIAEAEIAVTSVISRAEIGAVFAKAVRVGLLTEPEGQRCREAFRSEWPRYVRLPLLESTVARAEGLAWEHDLRGCDAVHLATALHALEAFAAPVTMATFDHRLWRAAGVAGLLLFPRDLDAKQQPERHL